MSIEKVDTVVVGAGQAGVAMSEHLGKFDIPHVVLERRRIAERWRSERWDSLVANGPAWHDRFPGMTYSANAPGDFPGKEAVADYLVAYADKIAAPIRCGVDVQYLERLNGRSGFKVTTSDGSYEAQNVVVATGPFQIPDIPSLVPENAGIHQIHSSAYRNPGRLPAGGILVVGAGSSGVQIADELARSGREVWLSVGPHDRPPRAYRGRDYCWWLGALGKWDAETPDAGAEHVTIAVSGARGGATVDFRRLAAQGITLVGRTESYRDGMLNFAADLAGNIARGDANYLSLLDEADAYAVEFGLHLPEEPEARTFGADPECMTNPIRALDLAQSGISSIIWATGFRRDYSWIDVDCFTKSGEPRHKRGVSVEPGLFFLGLPWQSRRGSSFIWGVWHDARYVADRISTRRRYLDYEGATAPQPANA